jgi:hypothetical protein
MDEAGKAIVQAFGNDCMRDHFLIFEMSFVSVTQDPIVAYNISYSPGIHEYRTSIFDDHDRPTLPSHKLPTHNTQDATPSKSKTVSGKTLANENDWLRVRNISRQHHSKARTHTPHTALMNVKTLAALLALFYMAADVSAQEGRSTHRRLVAVQRQLRGRAVQPTAPNPPDRTDELNMELGSS